MVFGEHRAKVFTTEISNTFTVDTSRATSGGALESGILYHG